MADHFGPGDPRNSWELPGPWFTARYPGECVRGGEGFEEGDTIRADGNGGWECQDCAEEDEETEEVFDPFRL